MSNLKDFGREYVTFDATNPVHRQYFNDFCRKHSWSHCPVRFELTQPFTDVIAMIKSQMLDYYISEEGNKK
ncbi:hypothetical protein UFOVP116_125 [uncultured Caudovirales phage]|uniref:Uncharacterized protein n=1 Tax=uncultured Caudovirales phage TaxID=2100421 RepID=A0A6J5L608_9CAUD|nr:hypothetical protein UFOVP116_125 [uncultured Caudovirales phage]